MTSKLKTTGKYSHKQYKCSECGKEESHGTNHWGEIYPYCYTCRKQTVWKCLEPIPEGYTTPKPWKLVQIGDICEIKQGLRLDAKHHILKKVRED